MKPVLTPAYGRDYKSKKAVLADFNAGKDFLAEPAGSYTNKADLEQLGYATVNIRYDRLRKVLVAEIGK